MGVERGIREISFAAAALKVPSLFIFPRPSGWSLVYLLFGEGLFLHLLLFKIMHINNLTIPTYFIINLPHPLARLLLHLSKFHKDLSWSINVWIDSEMWFEVWSDINMKFMCYKWSLFSKIDPHSPVSLPFHEVCHFLLVFFIQNDLIDFAPVKSKPRKTDSPHDYAIKSGVLPIFIVFGNELLVSQRIGDQSAQIDLFGKKN